ncbi:MAG: ComEC/Rec2 family competence protein, partial [Proteobacteria bacterium]|nr:ComEC/Rec2 family competence protein [Pseudomonadota bacterium]
IFNKGVGFLFKKNKVDHIKGHARMVSGRTAGGPCRVEVSKPSGDYYHGSGSPDVAETLTAENVIIATGAAPKALPFAPFDGKTIVSSYDAMILPKRPKSMVIVGSGAIGMEFAYFYNAFGTKVTVVEILDRVLPVEDDDICKLAKRVFTKQGMDILTGHTVKAIDVKTPGEATVTIADATDESKSRRVDCDIVLVAVGVGAGIYFALPAEPPNWMGAVLLAATVLAAVGLRRRAALLLLSIGLAGVATGFAASQLRTNLTAAPVLEKRIGSAMVTGRIVFVQSRGKAQRWLMEDLSISRLEPRNTPERIRLTNRVRGVALEPGMRIRVRATLMPPPSPAAPGAFDFPRLAWFASLGAVGFTTSRARIVGVEDRAFSTSLSALRQSMSARVRTALPGASGAVAAALMTGDRGAIPEDVLADMRDSGLAHLLAISGLHIGLVAGLFFFFVRGLLAAVEPVALRYPIKKWAAAGAMAAAFGYLLITGATVPTQRAFIMTGIVLTAIMLDRSAVSMRIVALAALAILILAPETLLSASFQMSFAAVVALVAVYESAGARFSRGRGRGSLRRRLLIYGAGILLTSLVAGLATTPFAVFHFNRFVIYGLAANMFAVPLTALWIMPWAMAAYVLMPFGLEGLALAPMGAIQLSGSLAVLFLIILMLMSGARRATARERAVIGTMLVAGFVLGSVILAVELLADLPLANLVRGPRAGRDIL